MSAIGVLALVPMGAIFGSKGAEDYSIAVISETMEEGGLVRRIGITHIIS
jgi:hypothetical protein